MICLHERQSLMPNSQSSLKRHAWAYVPTTVRFYSLPAADTRGCSVVEQSLGGGAVLSPEAMVLHCLISMRLQVTAVENRINSIPESVCNINNSFIFREHISCGGEAIMAMRQSLDSAVAQFAAKLSRAFAASYPSITRFPHRLTSAPQWFAVSAIGTLVASCFS
ncbi:hypothetical protein BD410DRAFT_461188 [Rickenella mellea]|uniref:Uncharacterized protein n=1 Tax=Rickenella mellea TaxID=50990 RepID=A0A4Y7PTU4_9AGAM|nr:hypothetical protein BD410DRAFT_461188 [Rickenella mellea]